MKRSLFAFFVLFISNCILAQEDNRFYINPGSTWRVDSIDAEWNIIEKTTYFIQKDTIINNLNYYKLYKSGVAYYDRPFYYNDVYVGAIREEENRIYFIKRNSATETCLYDFNLAIGDTITSAIAKGNTIISIDTLPGGRKILNYNIGHYTTGFLIEGIGTNGGLLSGGSSFIPLHAGQCACHLICYTEKDELVFQNTPQIGSNCDRVNRDHQYPVNTTAIWRYHQDIDNDTMVHYGRYQYFFDGDTAINSFHYYKLKKRTYAISKSGDGVFDCVLNKIQYMGALRDAGNKFYFVPERMLSEEVLYDFTLKPGERNKAKIFRDEWVYDVDTMLDNRRIIYFGNDRWSKIIIAGIGSVIDFLNEQESSSYLHIYVEDNVPVYHHYGPYVAELFYNDAMFPVCNKVNIKPNYFAGSEKELEVDLCYQIPAVNGQIPLFSGYHITRDGYRFKLDLYYYDDNPVVSGQPVIINIITETIPLGRLEPGFYSMECNVNKIQTDGLVDTLFQYVRFVYDFYLWNNPAITSAIHSASGIKIFPVPAKESISIESVDERSVMTSIEIYNMSGMKVFDFYTRPVKSINLDVSFLIKGLYIVKIRESDAFSVLKIIRE